jgi:aspartate aminotransferase
MTRLSHKIEALGESATIALTARARRMQAEGIPVISFTAGEPDFPTPPHVKEAALRAIGSDFTRYTPSEGIGELREAAASKLSRENGIPTTADAVVVTAGAKQGIAHSLLALCNPGDEVLVLAPYWVSYPTLVRLADATPVIVPLLRRDRFRPDPERIRRAITPRTRALILNSPCNPTGMVFTQEELEGIGEIASSAGLTVISDEVYEKFLYGGALHVSPAALEAFDTPVVTVNSVSKSYAMPGWRIGYCTGPRPLMEAVARIQGHVASCVNSVAQKAATAALAGPTDSTGWMTAEFERRRAIVIRSLAEIPDVEIVPPQGGMFVFLGVERLLGHVAAEGEVIMTSDGLARHLLEARGVGVIPGSAFGEEGGLRLSYCCAEPQLGEGLRRVREGLIGTQG